MNKIFFNYLFVVFFILVVPWEKSEAFAEIRHILNKIEQADFEGALETLWQQDASDPQALLLLGVLHAKGIGVERDFNAAHFFLYQSLTLGNDDAGFYICAYVFGDKESPQYSLRRSFDCYEKVAQLGNVMAKEVVAMELLRKGSINKFKNYSYEDADELMLEAYARGSEQGSGSAAYYLFLKSLNTEGTDQYSKFQISLLESAINNIWVSEILNGQSLKHLPANNLAFIYLDGNGETPNLPKYFQYTLLAAEYGDVEAVCRIAEAHIMGIGTQRDFHKAYAILNDPETKCKKLEALKTKLEFESNFWRTVNRSVVATSPIKARKDLGATRFSEIIRYSSDSTSVGVVASNSFDFALPVSSPSNSIRIGATIFGSDGTIYWRNGAITTSSKGELFQNIGSTTFGPNNSVSIQIGNTSIGPGLSFCNTYGNMKFCN